MKTCSIVAVSFAAALLSAGNASAGVTQVFSGTDDGASASGPWPNSAAAAASFLSAAAGFGSTYTETFENVAVGAGAQGASFGINGATVSSNTNFGPNDGFGGVNDTDFGGVYGFNVTSGGANWFGFPNTNSADSEATFAFDAPTNAFGFYTTGVQSFAVAELTVTFNDGVSQSFDLPVNVNGGASFFGFIDSEAFTSVTITSVSNGDGTDLWGIDNVSYNLASGAVPEPSTWAMMLAGLAGLGFFGYRSKRGAVSIAA